MNLGVFAQRRKRSGERGALQAEDKDRDKQSYCHKHPAQLRQVDHHDAAQKTDCFGHERYEQEAPDAVTQAQS